MWYQFREKWAGRVVDWTYVESTPRGMMDLDDDSRERNGGNPDFRGSEWREIDAPPPGWVSAHLAELDAKIAKALDDRRRVASLGAQADLHLGYDPGVPPSEFYQLGYNQGYSYGHRRGTLESKQDAMAHALARYGLKVEAERLIRAVSLWGFMAQATPAKSFPGPLWPWIHAIETTALGAPSGWSFDSESHLAVSAWWPGDVAAEVSEHGPIGYVWGWGDPDNPEGPQRGHGIPETPDEMRDLLSRQKRYVDAGIAKMSEVSDVEQPSDVCDCLHTRECHAPNCSQCQCVAFVVEDVPF